MLPSNKYINSIPEKSEIITTQDEENQERQPETVKKSPLQAAAEDREIALAVWKASADKNDEVRDALGRMLGWVEELVCDHESAALVASEAI